MYKYIASVPTLLSIRRVIQQSHCSPAQFYQGLLYRTIERCIEIMPMLVCFAWVYTIQTNSSLVEVSWLWLFPDIALSTIELSTVELAGSTHDASQMKSQNIGLFTLLLISLFILQLIFSYLGQRQSVLGSYHIIQGYRERLINRVRQLPLGNIYQHRSGQLAEMLTQDIKRIESIFTHISADLCSAIFAPFIWIIALLWLDWQLALSLIAGLPLAVLVLNGTRHLFCSISARKQDLFRNTAGSLTEFTLGIKTLRLFNQTQQWVVSLGKRFEDLKALSIGVEAWGAGPVLSYRLILEASVIVLFLVIANASNNSLVSSADTLSSILFLLLAYKLLGPLLEVSENLTVLRFAIESENKLNALFTMVLFSEPEQPCNPERFDIQFDKVSFSYEQQDRQQGSLQKTRQSTLQNISFVVPEKTVTAIVGPSGAGKSSIVNLVARFYEASAGNISIGGHHLANIGTDLLYEHISVVFQQVQLYDATVMENIRVGRQSATDAEVIAACKAVNCDYFICALPQGYQTCVGEGGSRLSGGERQRLSIARGLLKNAPILLLDEITSSVDPYNQYLIQQALNTLAQDKTVIVIAHRLSTIVNADQIIVINEGQIVEQGTHSSLIKNAGIYEQLWLAQGK
jgi:sulfate-transporting ATPase/ATP-binding cassette subfamily B protein